MASQSVEDGMKEEMNRIERLKWSRKIMQQERTRQTELAQEKALERIRIWSMKTRPPEKPYTNEDGIPYHVYWDLIGELRAAESRKRLFYSELNQQRDEDLRCQALMILQPNALQAVRLKYLLAISQSKRRRTKDPLSKSDRFRLNRILSGYS